MERILLVALFIVVSPLHLAIASGPSNAKATNTSSDDEDQDGSDSNQKDVEKGDLKTFTDKIKSIRSVSGEYDVFFVNHFGPYSVPFSLPNSKSKDLTPDEVLAKALKLGVPVTVTIDTKTDTLTALDSDLARAPAATPADNFELPPDLEYLRDLVKDASKPKN